MPLRKSASDPVGEDREDSQLGKQDVSTGKHQGDDNPQAACGSPGATPHHKIGEKYASGQPYGYYDVVLQRLPGEAEGVEHPRDSTDERSGKRHTEKAKENEHRDTGEEEVANEQRVVDVRGRNGVRGK